MRIALDAQPTGKSIIELPIDSMECLSDMAIVENIAYVMLRYFRAAAEYLVAYSSSNIFAYDLR